MEFIFNNLTRDMSAWVYLKDFKFGNNGKEPDDVGSRITLVWPLLLEFYLWLLNNTLSTKPGTYCGYIMTLYVM